MGGTGPQVMLTRSLCKQQIIEATSTRRLLKFLIIENAGDEKKWKDLLMPLLCEYYSTINQYIKLLMELFISGARDPLEPEMVKIETKYVEILRSQTSLMRLNDNDLQYKYGISLTVH
jgi:hypothetical protein